MNHGTLPAVIAGASVFGMVGSLWSGIRKPLADRYGTDEAPLEGLSTTFYVALSLLMVIAGLIVDYSSARWTLIVGSLVVASALFALAMSRMYAQRLAAVVGAAAGTACIGIAAIKLMPAAFFDSAAAASLNFGFVFITLGALVTTPATPLLFRALGLQRGLGIISVVALSPAALALLANGSEFAVPADGAAASFRLLGDPIIWLTAVVFLFYILVEGSVITWFVDHLSEFQTAPTNEGLLSLGFWLAFLVSRLLIAIVLLQWLPGYSESWFFVILGLLVAVMLGNMAGSQNRLSIRWGVWGLGLLLGPILPTLVGLLYREYETAQQGTALGTVFALGMLGSLVITPLTVAYGRGKSARVALRAPLTAALLLTAASVVLVLTLSSPLF